MHRLPYIFLLLLLGVACTEDRDPLDTRVVETGEQAPETDLVPLDLGDSIRLGAGERLELLSEHADLNLRLSFRASPEAKGRLRFTNGHALELPSLDVWEQDSQFLNKLRKVDPPSGAWQDLEVVYLNPQTPDDGSTLGSVYLNGNPVYYQQGMITSAGADRSLSLEVEEGTIELADVATAPRAGKRSYLGSDGEVVLNLPIIRYEYYEFAENRQDVRNWDELEPKKTGYINRLDLNGILERGNQYAIRFFADFYVPKAGEYRFEELSPSHSRVYVDDTQVIDHPGSRWLELKDGTIELDEGDHSLEVVFIQNGGWNHYELGYEDPNGNYRHLNDMDDGAAIPRPGRAEPIAPLETDNEPYLLRSFVYFPAPRIYEETGKRTHAVNVGEAQGPHYTLDLHNGSLLLVWRGGFVDVHEMWDDRGEPQVATPIGNALSFDGAPQWTGDLGKRWPTEDDEDFRHLRHELDPATGRPTFYYELDGSEVTDVLEPTDGGLRRTLENRGGEGELYTLLATARTITELAPGRFELRGPGMTLEVNDYPTGGLQVLRGGGRDRLVAELPAASSITYTLNW